MASYQVLVPASGDKAEALFIRDGYSFLAFLLPLPWLLFRRMWLHAALVLVAYIGGELLAEAFQIQAISMAVGLFVSLWLGFEGGHLRGQMQERRGWTLARVIEAGRIGDRVGSTVPASSHRGASLYFAFDTPIGPVYLAYGRSDGRNQSVYFFVGQP